jgi:hypothetical protein
MRVQGVQYPSFPPSSNRNFYSSLLRSVIHLGRRVARHTVSLLIDLHLSLALFRISLRSWFLFFRYFPCSRVIQLVVLSACSWSIFGCARGIFLFPCPLSPIHSTGRSCSQT